MTMNEVINFSNIDDDLYIPSFDKSRAMFCVSTACTMYINIKEKKRKQKKDAKE